MSLANGMYLMMTEDSSKKIGRWVIEDRSLLPKAVTIADSFDEIHQDWSLEAHSNGKYTLRNSGAVLISSIEGRQSDLVYCDLIQNWVHADNSEWTLESAGGKDLYTISCGGKSLEVPPPNDQGDKDWVKATTTSKQKFKLINREQYNG